MPHVTVIHGIVNKPAKDKLLDLWTRSLAHENGLDDEPGFENSHVISNDPQVQGALRPDEVFISFEALGLNDYLVKEVVWTNPPTELDATLTRLDRPVTGVQPYPVAPRLPMANSASMGSAIPKAESSLSHCTTTCCSITKPPEFTIARRPKGAVRAAPFSISNGVW